MHWVPASEQRLPGQQGPPALPQGLQIEVVEVPLTPQARSAVEHPVPVAGNMEEGQHGSPWFPQPQRPDLHTP